MIHKKENLPDNETLSTLLCEDIALDQAVDDMILEMLEDRELNRKADDISSVIRNLKMGRSYHWRVGGEERDEKVWI
jgi:hypothetical protein